jgi:excinuclease ABC subunit C
MTADLREQAGSLPDGPGVYLFRDAHGRFIYVGKAASLRDRVRSYFQKGLGPRTALMMSRAAGLECITTDSEVEALILESNLVKRHRPEFNIRLRDDKHFPYLRIALDEQWPAVAVVRGMERDGARYFGPYTRAQALTATLKAVRRIFPFRTCGDHRLATARRPCLHHDLGRCPAPCAGKVAREDYLANLRELCLFLDGRGDHVVRRLRERMEQAADSLEFERAAELRDQLRALELVVERQKMIFHTQEDLDALGTEVAGQDACVQVFRVRDGKLVGRESFLLATADSPPGEVVGAFLKQHYGAAAGAPPPLILVPAVPPAAERAAIENWLTGLRGARVRVVRPLRGDKRGLVDLAGANARLALAEAGVTARWEEQLTAGALQEIGDVLGLERPPYRIEAFDVSGFHGKETVASRVVFEGGRALKAGYRRYRLSASSGRDDCYLLQEVLHRRFRRGEAPPDLVLVDGGKGQLSAAREVLAHLGLDRLPVIALAKEHEHLYVTARPEPIVLPDASPALRLLRQMRDEAHRFAVNYHRILRRRQSLGSAAKGGRRP